MKRVLVILFCFLGSVTLLLAQNESLNFGDTPEADYFFGFNLVPNSGGMVHFALIKPLDNGKFDIKFVERKDFEAQIKGQQNSPANPSNKYLLAQYDIDPAAVIMLDSLWKLRYSEYPFMSRSGDRAEIGWVPPPVGGGMATQPNSAQWKILRTFGITKLSDYCYGEDFFRLLKSLSDPMWLEQYKLTLTSH